MPKGRGWLPYGLHRMLQQLAQPNRLCYKLATCVIINARSPESVKSLPQ